MKKTLIIAEAGVNHNGSIVIAKRLAQIAKECGADIVKYQTVNLDCLVSESAQMADYQKQNIGKETSQKDMLQKLLLKKDEFVELAAYCKEIGIGFLSTPFDIDSIGFLEGLGCERWKVPSGEITNLPYLEKIAETGKPVILSTGMSTMDEVGAAYRLLQENGAGKITLLHCTTEYPAPFADVNLLAMQTLRETFGCAVGYSDHTRGIEISLAAVAMGAGIIEKHFTLDRNMEGPDHKASLEPEELKTLVTSIRNIETALGDGKKRPMQSELGNMAVARKSIIAARDIKKGELLDAGNLTTKRPGSGISPMKWYEVLGTAAIRDFQKDELIEV